MLSTFKDFFLKEVRSPDVTVSKELQRSFTEALDNLIRSFVLKFPDNIRSTINSCFNNLQYNEERLCLIPLIKAFEVYKRTMSNSILEDSQKHTTIETKLNNLNVPITFIRSIAPSSNNSRGANNDNFGLINLGQDFNTIFSSERFLNKAISILTLKQNIDFDLGTGEGHPKTHLDTKQKVVRNEIDFIRNICKLNVGSGYMLGVVGNGEGLDGHTKQALSLGFTKDKVTYFELIPKYYVNIVGHHPILKPAVILGNDPDTFKINPQLLPPGVEVGPRCDFFNCDKDVSLVFGDLTKGYPPAFNNNNDQVTFIDFDITAGISTSGRSLGNNSTHAEGVLANADTFLERFPNVKAIVQVFEFQRTHTYNNSEYAEVFDYFNTQCNAQINTEEDFAALLGLAPTRADTLLHFLTYANSSRTLGTAKQYANVFYGSKYDVLIQPYYGAKRANMISFTLCLTDNDKKIFQVDGSYLARQGQLTDKTLKEVEGIVRSFAGSPITTAKGVAYQRVNELMNEIK